MMKAFFSVLLGSRRFTNDGSPNRKSRCSNPVETVFQSVVCIDGEISGNDREGRSILNLFLQEGGDGSSRVIVADSRISRYLWYHN